MALAELVIRNRLLSFSLIAKFGIDTVVCTYPILLFTSALTLQKRFASEY